MAIKDLSKAQCILLTVHYATQANISALHSFTPHRPDALEPELILRVLLTYLPETVEPKKYISYITEVTSRLYLDHEREDIEVDLSPVEDIDDATAQRKIRKLDLLVIKPARFPPHAPDDLLTRFICHRSYRIDQETGALNHVQELVQPFLQRNDFIRVWYVSVVLPCFRLYYEYYPSRDHNTLLKDFEKMEGREAVDLLLRKVAHEDKKQDAQNTHISRDIKGLIGPWAYGHTERELRNGKRDEEDNQNDRVDQITQRVRKISLTGVKPSDRTGHDWEYVYKWIVQHAQENFASVTTLIEEWHGPIDIDVAGLEEGKRPYLDFDIQQKLDAQYAQAAFASCYAAQAEDEATIQGAHAILARLAELLDFVPPPDLATSVDALPHLENHAVMLDESETLKDLEPTALLKPEHPLTTPRMETYMLLQMMVYSAYQFSNLGYPVSIVKVARLHFYSTAEEQMQLLRRILQGLGKAGRRDDLQWTADRAKLIWLWNWGIEPEEVEFRHGAGVLGKISKEDFEKEMLQTFVDASCYELAGKLLLSAKSSNVLSEEQAELVVYNKAMEAYDGASNGNRTRGGIKKASDILTAFKQYFPKSKRLAEASSLISATHSASFYSLTLQHGVPFQPVNIRVAKDPIELINKVLEQNPRSYTKLDDLITIADNLVSAGLVKQTPEDEDDDRDALSVGVISDEQLRAVRRYAERRVTFMAVEAALREDDFETAYSYIVNRLTPAELMDGPPSLPSHTRNASKSSTLSKSNTVEDDISWRAAYLAGRFRPTTTTPITLRRLEQRTELLSLALLLAPTSALTDILSAWRRCEEESSALQQAEHQDEREFDDHADRRQASALPGHFTLSGEQPEMILNQKRREMGRMATSHADSETPMSMFDLTRSAARAFSKNVNLGSRQPSEALSDQSEATEGDESRVRRRDLVANAVSGSLASGIGWVLGAKPVDQQ